MEHSPGIMIGGAAMAVLGAIAMIDGGHDASQPLGLVMVIVGAALLAAGLVRQGGDQGGLREPGRPTTCKDDSR